MKNLPSLRSVVDKYGLNPKKSLGQNFLFDQNITDKIVRVSGVGPDDEVFEIGPGPGGLTRSILATKPLKLTVVEQDFRCIAALSELKPIYPNLHIINGDALKINEGELITKKAKMIANLPYNIGTILLMKWFENLSVWSSFTLMFQKEVAERIVAIPGSKAYGRLSIISQLLCDVDKHFYLNPEVFFPAPKVTSTVISLYPKQNIPSNEVIKTIKMIAKHLFNQRRKMLRSSLKNVHTDLEGLIFGTKISLSQRPEELSIVDFIMIAENYLSLTNI